MAQQTLVLDASVGVKWFSGIGEAHVPQARAILAAHASGSIILIVPDIFLHEISNTLVHKKNLSIELIEESIVNLFALGLLVVPASEELIRKSAHLARKSDITEYDACYVVVAMGNNCPLVTANPRHQGKEPGCRVIPLEEWRVEG